MNDCVFCSIIAGISTASVVYEDASVLAFMDKKPVNTGHTLVIPKRHFGFLSDLDQEGGAHLFGVTLRVAQAVRKSGIRCEGVNLFVADGEAAGQDVFHVHVHVIPRYKGDKFLIKPNYGPRPTREELNQVAVRIKSAI